MSERLAAGGSFGDYRVVRLLGKGGMGEVWLLENASGGRVAAKILTGGADHASRKRFLREAEFALGVKHPNLVEVYDVGEDPETGLCYILMEYVPGGSLADVIKDIGPLPIADAVAVVEAMALVLELAREKGIVHRDIKPANIMFGSDGTPKLADLGIARGGIGGTDTTTVTQTGMMIGTPAYMSPEQMLDAHHVDTRADIYSLGVVFFEMLTGERPNKDDTIVQLMAKAVKGEPLPDVRTLRPEVSASLAQLLAMMVAPDKDGRISTPDQITNALGIIEHGGAFESPVEAERRRVMAREARRRRRKRRRLLLVSTLAILGTVGLSAIVAGIWWLTRDDSPPSPPDAPRVGERPLSPERGKDPSFRPSERIVPRQAAVASVQQNANRPAVQTKTNAAVRVPTAARNPPASVTIPKVVSIDDVLNEPVAESSNLFSTPVADLPEVMSLLSDKRVRFTLHETVARNLVVDRYVVKAGQNEDGTVRRLRDVLREICDKIGCTFKIVDDEVVLWCDRPGPARNVAVETEADIKVDWGSSPPALTRDAVRQRLQNRMIDRLNLGDAATLDDVVAFFRKELGLNFQPDRRTRSKTMPPLVASDLRGSEALKLVCDCLDFKYEIHDNIVVLTPKGTDWPWTSAPSTPAARAMQNSRIRDLTLRSPKTMKDLVDVLGKTMREDAKAGVQIAWVLKTSAGRPPPELSPVSLREVSVWNALDVVSRSCNMGFVLNQNSVTIQPLSMMPADKDGGEENPKSLYTPQQIKAMRDPNAWNAMRKATEIMFPDWRICDRLKKILPKFLRSGRSRHGCGYRPYWGPPGEEALGTCGSGDTFETKELQPIRANSELRFWVHSAAGTAIVLKGSGMGRPFARIVCRCDGAGLQPVVVNLSEFSGHQMRLTLAVERPTFGAGSDPTSGVLWKDLKLVQRGEP